MKTKISYKNGAWLGIGMMLACCFVSLPLVSCTEDNEPTPPLVPEANTQSCSFAWKSDSAYVTITGSRAFTTSSSEPWCSATAISDTVLKIAVTQNDRVETRNAVVTVTADGVEVPVSIAVAQSGALPVLAVAEVGVYVSGGGQEFTLHVTANFPTVFELPEWVQQKNDTTFIAGTLPETMESRRDTITLRAADATVTDTIISIPVVQLGVPVINVMTYNILYAGSTKLSWAGRRASFVQYIMQEDIDILGMQEVEYTQHSYLRNNLKGYTAVGMGRDGGTSGEYSSVFYRKDRFIAHASGTFWLSTTPNIISRGWDAALNRIATWVELEDRVSGKRIFAINTHIDHVGVEAQRESVRLLVAQIHERRGDRQVVFTGDFNMTPDNANVQFISDIVANPYPLRHTKEVAEVATGPNGTFPNLGTEPGRFIDYIFVSEGVRVLQHNVLPDRLNGVTLSDHAPVTAKILLVED